MIKNKIMTPEERLKYTRMALRTSGINIENNTTEMIMAIVDEVKEKGGDFSLIDSAVIESMCEKSETQRQNARKQSTVEDNQPSTEEWVVRPKGDPLQSAGV